jgi:adenylyltransferase/sulfurtransferase
MQEISVEALKQKIDDNDEVFILDVREPFEQYQSKLDYEHSTLIPIGDLSNRVDEIQSHREDEVVCLCRSGARSAQACKILEKEGFKNVKNLKGGINQWAREIDTSLPVY